MKFIRLAPSAGYDGLSREKSVRWFVANDLLSQIPWVREALGPRHYPCPDLLPLLIDQKKSIVIAKTYSGENGRGRILRTFYLRAGDIDAYSKIGTCPVEAVHIPSIRIGEPSDPAFPYIAKDKLMTVDDLPF